MATRGSRKKPTPDADSTPTGELAEVAKSIEKRYGSGAMRSGSKIVQPDRISTGVFTMDFSLLGGIPHNRTSMFVGEKHSGKSMLASLTIANAQKRYPDKRAILIDVEHTFESSWAQKLGVDLDLLHVVEPDTGEMAVDLTDALLATEESSLVVVDSIAALTPFKEGDSSAEDAFVGLQARLVGTLVRRSTSTMIRERHRGHLATLLFLNQFRMKIGGYGDPRTVPGGKALEFSTSVQAIIKNKENKGKDSTGIDTVLNNEHSFTITKNKMCNGPRTGEFMIVREEDTETGLAVGDVDDATTVLAYAKKFGIYRGGGSRWSLEFDDVSLTFGKAQQAIQALRDDGDLYWAARTHIIRMQAAKLGMPKEFIARIV